MTDKLFDVYSNYTDEFETNEFVGRLGLGFVKCRICSKEFQIGMPFRTTQENNEGLIILNDSELVNHYKTCHSELVKSCEIEEYTGQKGDRPCIIVLHKLDIHTPPTKEGYEYYHLHLFRKHRETQTQRIEREREEHNKQYNPSYVGKPIQENEKSWRFLASNIKNENVGDYLTKRVDEFKAQGIDIMFRVKTNKKGNLEITYQPIEDKAGA